MWEVERRRRPATVRKQSKARLKQLYQELMGITRAVVREAARIPPRTSPPLTHLGERLRATVGLVHRVLAQTRARILRGEIHYRDKVVSVFERHTEVIRKGKAAKPTEFGKLVKIQEAEAQFITDYEVCAMRVPDNTLWRPSLERHEQLFGRPPRLAVADGGFASRANEQLARERNVRHAVLTRHRRQRPSRTVRAALRWRTGSEGRISVLKRRHGLARCRYRGLLGMERWVGLGILANDLLALGRASPVPG